MKVEKEACEWCHGYLGEIETFEHDFVFHRKCYEQMQEIHPQLIEELKQKPPPFS